MNSQRRHSWVILASIMRRQSTSKGNLRVSSSLEFQQSRNFLSAKERGRTDSMSSLRMFTSSSSLNVSSRKWRTRITKKMIKKVEMKTAQMAKVRVLKNEIKEVTQTLPTNEDKRWLQSWLCNNISMKLNASRIITRHCRLSSRINNLESVWQLCCLEWHKRR